MLFLCFCFLGRSEPRSVSDTATQAPRAGLAPQSSFLRYQQHFKPVTFVAGIFSGISDGFKPPIRVNFAAIRPDKAGLTKKESFFEKC